MLIARSTSPSVYVIYTGLRADEHCYSGRWLYDSYVNGSYVNGSWSDVSFFWSQLGSMYTRVTRAYALEALSTGGDCYGTSWAAINYTKLYSPQPDYKVITQAACYRQGYRPSKGQSFDASYWLAGDLLLSMPPDLSLVDPSWSTCTAETLGGYDPPRALTAAVALIPDPKTTPDPSNQARPASSPIQPLPVQTPAAEPDALAKGQSPADGSGFDPSNPSADQTSKMEGALASATESNTGPDTGDQDPSPQQGAGHENPLASDPHQESDTQDDEDPSNMPDPTGQGQQNAPTVAEAQQDGESDSPPNMNSDQGSDIQGEGSSAVDTTELNDPQGASIVVGTHTVLVDPSGTSFDGAPIDPGGSPVTVSGAAAMIQGSSITIADAIVHLPSSTVTENPILIAGHTMTPLAGAVAIDGETLHAGESPRTIAGTLMSLDRNDNLAMNPSVQALPTPPPLPSPALETLVDGQTTTIDGQAIQVLANGVSIAGMTLTPEAPLRPYPAHRSH